MKSEHKSIMIGLLTALAFLLATFWLVSKNVSADRPNEILIAKDYQIEKASAEFVYPEISVKPSSVKSEKSVSTGARIDSMHDLTPNDVELIAVPAEAAAPLSLADIDSVIRLTNDLTNIFVTSNFQGEGWYYFSYEKLKILDEDRFRAEDTPPIISSHSIKHTWLYVNQERAIQDRITILKDVNGEVLQQIARINGVSINITGYNIDRLKNTAVGNDTTFNRDLEYLFDVSKVLSSLPNDATIETWVNTDLGFEQFSFQTTHATGEETPAKLHYLAHFNSLTGELIGWEGGFSDADGEFIPELQLTNYHFEALSELPEEAQAILDTGIELLSEEK